ncbi:MAG: hypothetical protein KIT00_07165 [Rhodospirillales bacterium]|nr:hypothetical protein [Rhodospirillales bacterium]
MRGIFRSFLILALVVVVSGCSPSRVLEAVDVLDDIDAGSGPSDLKQATSEPTRKEVRFVTEDTRFAADLYLPAEDPRAGMVLIPGAAPTGKDDPRLVDFAKTMARARFEVLVPDLPNMRALRVTSGDARLVAESVTYMARRGQDRPLGLTTISFAVGPAVLALFEPGVGRDVDFVVSVGGYYDMEAAITFFTSGAFRETPDMAWKNRTPNAFGKWLFVLSNADRLPDPRDRDALRAMARAKLQDSDADVSAVAANLGPDGRAVTALLNNRDPDRVPDLVAALPSAIVEEIRALDLKTRGLDTLDAQFVLVHGRDDPIIPETESMKFAKAAGPARARLYLVDSLRHVDPQPPGVTDTLILLRAIYRVLSLRDGT